MIIDINLIIDILDDKPPEGSYEVCDHENDYNQSENLIWVHYNILSLDPVSSCRVVEVALDQSLNSADIKNGHHFWKSCESDHSCVDGICEEQVEGKRGKEIDDHPATFCIPYCDFLDILNYFLSLFVLVRLKAIENKIKSENNGY